MNDERHQITRHQKAAACALLSATHAHVSMTMARIAVLSEEIRAQQHVANELRAQIRADTEAWFKDHAEEAEAISELFFGPDQTSL